MTKTAIELFLKSLNEDEICKSLARQMGLSPREVRLILKSAGKRYKTYNVPKRNGRGNRLIEQPAREVKAIQRWIMNAILEKFPVHDAAKAYKRRVGLIDNLTIHQNSSLILKCDFKDFFNSIKRKDFITYLSQYSPEPESHTYWCRSLFRERPNLLPYLSIGAPSSPMLSNILLFDFDQKVSTVTKEFGLEYTRYADDVTISGSNREILLHAEVELEKIIGNLSSPVLVLNREKRKLVGRGQRRTITGINITPQYELSIGRDRKKLIRAKLNRFAKEELTTSDCQMLLGEIAFLRMVEPEAFTRLLHRMGSQRYSELCQKANGIKGS